MEDKESAEASEVDALIAKYSPFLKEIRKRIIFTLIFFAISTIVGFVFYDKIIRFLIELLNLKGINIVFTTPFQFLNLAVSCGLATGLVLIFPLLIFQILSFLKPALRRTEFKMLIGFLPFSMVLFLGGFLFGVMIMKWQIQLSLEKSKLIGIGNILDINHLISTVLMVSVLMGLAFQLPIVLTFLVRLGIISYSGLSKQRIWAYLGSFVFAILLPPDSIIADLFLSLPTIILFELTLLVNKILG